MSYALGAASVTNAPLRLQYTVAGDGWDSLGRAYGVPALNIIKMQPFFQSNPINNKSVQAFIKGLPGWNRDTDIFAFDSKNNPGTVGPDGKPEGFAHFGANTQLLLPDMPRLDGKQPGPKPTTPVDTVIEAGTSGKGPLIALAALTIGGLILLGRKKKKPSPKPVAF